MRLTVTVLIAASALLAGCATPQPGWEARSDADLSADKAACEKEAAIDMDSPRGYTASRYGVAAALASRVDADSVQGGAADRLHDAVLGDCMVRKGWKPK